MAESGETAALMAVTHCCALVVHCDCSSSDGVTQGLKLNLREACHVGRSDPASPEAQSRASFLVAIKRGHVRAECPAGVRIEIKHMSAAVELELHTTGRIERRHVIEHVA